MGKFSDMDILIQESYERGYRNGFKEAVSESKKIVKENLKRVGLRIKLQR